MMTWCLELEGGGLVAQIYSLDATSKLLRSLRVMIEQQALVLLRHQAWKIGIFAWIGCLVTLIARAFGTQIWLALTDDPLCCYLLLALLLALYHLSNTTERCCMIQLLSSRCI